MWPENVPRPTGASQEAEAYYCRGGSKTARPGASRATRATGGPARAHGLTYRRGPGAPMARRCSRGQVPRLRVRGSLVRHDWVWTAVSPWEDRASPPNSAAGRQPRRKPCVGGGQPSAKERLRAGSLWQDEVAWVFTTELGTPLDVRNVGRWFTAQAASAGVGRNAPQAAAHVRQPAPRRRRERPQRGRAARALQDQHDLGRVRSRRGRDAACSRATPGRAAQQLGAGCTAVQLAV